MATVQMALQMYNGMSSPLREITNSMNTVISTFETMQAASAHPVDLATMKAARAELTQVEAITRSLEEDIKRNNVAQQEFNAQLHSGEKAVDGLGSKIKQFVGMYAGVQGIKMGVQFVADSISLQNVQTEAETKLRGIMQQRMGASPESFQSIKDLASAQQRLGVVGDEVQMMGAQQLATFLSTGDALSTLIPAMNNLAVQQNGVNVSTEAMTNIGNMMGKQLCPAA